MAIKMTFSLDEATAARLKQAAERLRMPKSAVVREAIRDYSERIGRLSEQDRLRMLRTFDQLVPAIPQRPVHEFRSEASDGREPISLGETGLRVRSPWVVQPRSIE